MSFRSLVYASIFILAIFLAQICNEKAEFVWRDTKNAEEINKLTLMRKNPRLFNLDSADHKNNPAQNDSIKLLASRVGSCSHHGGLNPVTGQGCLCAGGFSGPRCERKQFSAGDGVDEKKYNGYAKTICKNHHLSASVRIPDATVRAGAKLIVDRIAIKDGAFIYDSCVGCGGWLVAIREIFPNIEVCGCDISAAMSLGKSKTLFPTGAFVSGACTTPPSLFLPSEMFDVVIAGFCINNIMHEDILAVFGNKSMTSNERFRIICQPVQELYRTTKRGGGVFLPQTYESDAKTTNGGIKNLPVHFFTKCFPHLPLTKEGEAPPPDVRVKGGIIYGFEEELYRHVGHKDHYYGGKMKTIIIHKPIHPGV